MILSIWKIGWGYNPDRYLTRQQYHLPHQRYHLPHQRLATQMVVSAPSAVNNPDGGIRRDLPPNYPFGVFDRRKDKSARVSPSSRLAHRQGVAGQPAQLLSSPLTRHISQIIHQPLQ